MLFDKCLVNSPFNILILMFTKTQMIYRLLSKMFALFTGRIPYPTQPHSRGICHNFRLIELWSFSLYTIDKCNLFRIDCFDVQSYRPAQVNWSSICSMIGSESHMQITSLMCIILAALNHLDYYEQGAAILDFLAHRWCRLRLETGILIQWFWQVGWSQSLATLRAITSLCYVHSIQLF